MENVLLKYVKKVMKLIEEIVNKSLYYSNNKTCQSNFDEHSLYDNNINFCYYCNEKEGNEILFQSGSCFSECEEDF